MFITFLTKKYDLLGIYTVRYKAFKIALENTGKQINLSFLLIGELSTASI
jgi:hypothetical protein|tara:strand:+ start:126 stop:275 length:150 start_codon:yes stop_codon:yes gene_type:complete